MSLAPLILAAVLQEVPQNDSMLRVFWAKFVSSFFARHQFIYAVSFITPIFYLLWERYEGLRAYFSSGKRSVDGIKLTPPGFGTVLVWSVLFFLLTTVAYANTEAQATSGTPRTILASWSDFITVAVYAFGLLCWYFMILEGSTSPATQYFNAVKQQENEDNEEAQAFSKRIAQSEEKGQ